jgi:hypothetical protein
MSEDFEDGFYLVKIRRDVGEVKANAEQIDGKVYYFTHGWTIEESDSKKFAGEFAMIPQDENYPRSAPTWIASGDLVIPKSFLLTFDRVLTQTEINDLASKMQKQFGLPL